MGYRLEWKQGAGAYAAVPLVASQKPQPVIEAADCTVSGSNTAQATWAVSHPAAATGDLLIFYVAWDDSVATTAVTAPAGPNGEVMAAVNTTPITDTATETRAKAWYVVATGSWTATTKTFTPNATETWSATCIKVPAGEFDSASPVGASNTRTTTGTADTAALSPAFTAGASDGSGTLVWCASVDADPLATTVTNWTVLQRQDLGDVAHGVAVRVAAVTDSESIAGGDTWAITSDSWTSIGFIVRAPTVNNPVYVSASSNITAGGEATTFQLSAPSGKATSDFDAGRMWDDENGTDTVTITTDNYTELEWCIKFGASASGAYDFRVTDGGAVLNTYSQTPQITITSGDLVSVPARSHTYTAQATQVRARVAPVNRTHSYGGLAPKVSSKVAPGVRGHTYNALLGSFVIGAMVPGTAAHTYSAKIAQAKSGIVPGLVTHTYTARVPKANQKVMPLRAIHTNDPRAPQVRARVVVPFRTHVYTVRQPVVIAKANIPTADHNYNARPVGVNNKVRYGETFHSYTGIAPKANASVMPAARTHSYIPRVLSLNTTFRPPAFGHTYVPRAPFTKRSVGPATVAHSYLGRIPSTLAGNAMGAPMVAHVYTGRVPQAKQRLQDIGATHVYTAQVPRPGEIVNQVVAVHTYTAMAVEALSGYILRPSQAVHTYTGRIPSGMGSGDVYVIPGHPLGRGRR
jgi:hypothetical protein